MFQIFLKPWWFPQISLKRLKSLMNVPDFLKSLMISLKYTSASRKRVTHTQQMKLRDKQKKSNQNVWVDGFFWHGNSARVRFQNPPKAFKTLHSKPLKSLQNTWNGALGVVRSERFKNLPNTSNGTQTGRDAHVRFSDRLLQTAQISLKRCRFPHISLKRLKLLMISLKAWWFP